MIFISNLDEIPQEDKVIEDQWHFQCRTKQYTSFLACPGKRSSEAINSESIDNPPISPPPKITALGQSGLIGSDKSLERTCSTPKAYRSPLSRERKPLKQARVVKYK